MDDRKDASTCQAKRHCPNGAAKRSIAASLAMGITVCLGASLVTAGFAHAEPAIATSATSHLAKLATEDPKPLFGILTFVFSLIAAGFWHRSFRDVE